MKVFFKGAIQGLRVVVLKMIQHKILPHINQMIREPLFWVILIIIIGLVIIGIIEERRGKE